MKRGLKLIFSFLFIFLILTTFISASPFSDFWNKLTGKTIASAVCGNGVLESGENCEGNQFLNGAIACNSWSTTHKIGVVSCSNCTINTASCIACSLTDIPTPVPSVTPSATPTSTATVSPSATPTSTETASPSATPTSTETASPSATPSATASVVLCGNGEINYPEQCDGTKFLNDFNLCGIWVPTKPVGVVSCNSNNCTVNTNSCAARVETCKPEGEVTALDSDCCSKQSRTKCAFLFFGCSKFCTAVSLTCPNGHIDSGEECDGSLLNGKTCTGLGYDTGTLSCNSNCKFTGCRNIRQREATPAPSNSEDEDEGTNSNQEVADQLEEQRLTREYQQQQAELASQQAEVAEWEAGYLREQAEQAAAGEDADCIGMACPN
jgi:hypothetical protein